jgi:D-aspartate ligase
MSQPTNSVPARLSYILTLVDRRATCGYLSFTKSHAVGCGGLEIAHYFLSRRRHGRCWSLRLADCRARRARFQRQRFAVRRELRGCAVAVFDNYWATTLAFARSLGRQGVPLHFYGSGAGRWSRYCTRHSRCPPVDSVDEFQPWLRERLRSGDITRVAPTTDMIAFHASALRNEFAPEVQRTIAPLVEIENCLIKTRFSAINGSTDSRLLPTFAPDSVDGAIAAAAALGYPVMMKPKSHLAVGLDRGHLLMDERDLLRHYRQYRIAPGQECIAASYPELAWPLLQRYIASARNRVYSVTGIKDADNGVLTACVSYKRDQWPPDTGVSTLQISHDDGRILEFGLNIVDKTLSRGIFEVELLAEGDALYAIDLNPRAFGFLELDLARGSDLPWLWFRSTLEVQAPIPRRPPTEVPIEARHWLLRALKALAGAQAPPDAAEAERSDRSKARVSVSMLGHRSDPLPMIISNLHLLRHPRSLMRAQFASSGVARYDKV